MHHHPKEVGNVVHGTKCQIHSTRRFGDELNRSQLGRYWVFSMIVGRNYPPLVSEANWRSVGCAFTVPFCCQDAESILMLLS